MCFIHSLFNEFGSRELVADTGIVLNDRLANLVVPRPGEPVGANALGPGKRPLHTLHGYIVEWPDGRAVAGATPGGRGQIQTNLQVLVRLIDRGAGLPAAVAAPRWVHGMPRSSADDDTFYIEPELAHLAPGLAARGHLVEVVSGESTDRFGNCTVVGVTADGVEAAADHRRGGKAAPGTMTILGSATRSRSIGISTCGRRSATPSSPGVTDRPSVHGRSRARLPPRHRQQQHLERGWANIRWVTNYMGTMELDCTCVFPRAG